ncbi:hypothetical protein Mmc1_3691 [Magnetococcus marinus MC-1]|uniref:Uncharacterized protein n=1 Tax=Magnetococcus marinus (strain ATCC BAA-1437 / JCM 17883 / MC-1) TaxID=156889 RepID=A0LDY3_MAGMM|nr:hypothetical protein [Magnetococcus marinus]ABK46176.1 hypothetical protein Mmc1_3691 [Magnetococcus marinus MC-1]
MRFLLVPLLMLMLIPTQAAARVVYEDGPFAVREVKDGTKTICKLEISLYKEDRIAAYLALFNNENYYGELFTERRRVGKARNKVTVQFDDEPEQSIKFVEEAPGMDTDWRWQYLELNQPSAVIDSIARKRHMKISFFNGMETFEFSIPLKGSSKAVKRLQRCNRR